MIFAICCTVETSVFCSSSIFLSGIMLGIRKVLAAFVITIMLPVSSKFEVNRNIIVITKADNTLRMPNIIPLKNIEEEQKIDRYTVQQIAKIMQFLRNIED